MTRDGPTRATVAMKDQRSLPNKDFVLRYRTATDRIGNAFLVHRDERGGFFTLILQPPQRVAREQAVGHELVFVIDTSGSMSGYPLLQAKWVVDEAIRRMGPLDTFNLITFSGDDHVLWDAPRPNTAENRREAEAFLASRESHGGTEMLKAIDAALVRTRTRKPAGPAGTGEKAGEPAKPEPIRVVCFVTDGEVGNDLEIIDAVKRNAGTTRVFAFGIGNSVNRFLLDGIAREGRGETQYVLLEDKAPAAAKKFYERIDAPVLTNVSIDWGDLPVAPGNVYPAPCPTCGAPSQSSSTGG